MKEKDRPKRPPYVSEDGLVSLSSALRITGYGKTDFCRWLRRGIFTVARYERRGKKVFALYDPEVLTVQSLVARRLGREKAMRYLNWAKPRKK